ncbi:MAG: proteasome ATPase [Arthrobacter sp.]|jgi:proteasome-associated ATPase|nr:proteasome ATPase [Arthrobacter sp.]
MSTPAAQDGLRTELSDARKRALELSGKLQEVSTQNTRLVDALQRAREKMEGMRQALEHDGDLPFGHGVVVRVHRGGTAAPGTSIKSADVRSVDIAHGGRRVRTSVSPLVDFAGLRPGTEVLLNEALVVVALLPQQGTGELMTVKEVLAGERLLVSGPADDQRVVVQGGELTTAPPRPGELVLVEQRSMVATQVVRPQGYSALELEHVPETRYADIGGLGPQIEAIRDAVELPFLHSELFAEHQLRAPRGVLLYGPPGCGKTLIAQAVAHSLSEEAGTRGYFLNIKGPELLDKYVGETERQIRLIFDRARDKAAAGHPVVIFFDEMDALFRTRGTGVSSDVETTIVPQLLAEIDGVEKLENVLVIGATNREDMLDPALLRPGRLDVKVRIRRPDREGSLQVLALYLNDAVPLARGEVEHYGGEPAAASGLCEVAVEEIFSRDSLSAMLELTDEDGTVTVLYRGDLVSGASLRNIVDRAKRAAIKRVLAGGERGLDAELVRLAVRDEFAELGQMPASGDPEEWARVSGRRGARLVKVRSLAVGA